jgi:isoleucyl-tRNA synthetase
VEAEAKALWEERQVYPKAKAQGQQPKSPVFYFLDGPPYTSGKVHLGTAWNKILKDLVLRYKRMGGYNVWDRAGYDMHGLPSEHATEAELGISGREQILTFGVERFIEACRTVCTRNLAVMNEDFIKLGVWMDFENAYQTISKEFMEGEWWLVKRAHENGRLYEGERTMPWDAVNATALAKHELDYENVTEPAIYVKFPIVKDGAQSKDEFLLVWTTTPWTIPFNLAVMANPDVTYCRVRVVFDEMPQTWVMAKDLVEDLCTSKISIPYEIEREFLGKELIGLAYAHPFARHNAVYAELKAKHPKVHTVILSHEYVDTSVGTGLVHCAPGCGPEDYEVGHRNNIPPFNTIDEQGFCREIVPCIGLEAKKEDEEFIRLIDREDALVFTHKYTHEYPFGQRSKKPVIFRTTKQWFLKVEDIKENLIEENDRIAWVPQAAYNAFNAWLENLRDNSISKQRFWGTPLPVWRNADDLKDYIVVGSAKELAELARLPAEPEDLHIPTVDRIVIRRKGKDGKEHEYRRVPDVLDVWVDAGTTSWNCLDYPRRHDHFDRLYPADFILEGKDQIRGWFNLLHVTSMVAMGRPSFKACYMHGYINDVQGRKMSKSLKNYILPDEVTGKYGVDATRYYMIGAANPGFDMNYNFDDLEVKFRNLLVYWNLHKYLIELAQLGDIKPVGIEELDERGLLGIEERYALSRLHNAMRETTRILDEYRLNEAPLPAEGFLLDVSRTYVQLVRDKATAGADDEKLAVVSVLLTCLREGMTLFAPVAPYFTEVVYQHLRAAFPDACAEESIHLRAWPRSDEGRIDGQLEKDFLVAQDLIGAILAARDKAQLGVRWPVAEVRVDCTPAQQEAILRMEQLVLTLTNIKEVGFDPVDISYTIEPNTKAIGRDFGKETQLVMHLIERHAHDLVAMLKSHQPHAVVDNKTIRAEHLNVTRVVPDKYVPGEGKQLRAYLDVLRTPELEREGYAREVIRRLQSLRKKAGLVKSDRIAVEIAAGDTLLRAALEEHAQTIAQRCGAERFTLTDTLSQGFSMTSEERIKGTSFVIGFSVVSS